MSQLFIVIMLLVVFAGLIAFLIYSLLSYRKRNIIKFLILVCMVSGCEIAIAQSENISDSNIELELNTEPEFGLESEPVFESGSNYYPGPIVLPELHKAGNLLEVSIYGMTDYYNSDFNETTLEETWLAMMSDMNNISSNNTSSNLTLIA